MTVSSFITLLTFLSGVNVLLTQATKKLIDETRMAYSSNVVALIDAVVCGFVGTLVYFLTAGDKIGSMEILMAVLMAISVWVGSMVGYDKVTQMIRQIGEAGNGRD